ncbi:hypothetical protein EC973_000384 [Apophysomyces ossiformis]|uniref:Phosphatase activator n=1 Tax=Apophysomyces ossiformis TaxID=679940 RepID=A0A8H7BKY0_9FUNG|nr:hypothetical protein EC973_000384 [Apophysomyces ossiformis]
MSPTESPITQAPRPHFIQNTEPLLSRQTDDEVKVQSELPSQFKLCLRGVHVDVYRDILVSLPESLLIAMFPNGFVLNSTANEKTSGHTAATVLGNTQSDVVNDVDFDPKCLVYVLDFFEAARQQFVHDKRESTGEGRLAATALSAISAIPLNPAYYPLLTKQTIIVLREELDYFVLPQQQEQAKAYGIHRLKYAAGLHLQKYDLVFDALLRNINKEGNEAEQHLVDMLCDAGFSREDRWPYRALEPKRACIGSLSLINIKTVGANNRMGTAQKLMLFWKKPARKCWWDNALLDLEGIQVRLWARRTWTLELALV